MRLAEPRVELGGVPLSARPATYDRVVQIPDPEALPPETRPSSPDRELLRMAAEELGRTRQCAPPKWTVLNRMERRWSTIFVMNAESAGGSDLAYYKEDWVHSDPDYDGRRQRYARCMRALVAELELYPKLADALQAESVGLARPIAVDAASLRAVRLAVPGRVSDQLATPFAPSLALCRRVGKASRLMDDAMTAEFNSTQRSAIHDDLSRYVGKALDRLPVDLGRSVALLLEELLSQIDPSGSYCWSHGDLGPTNLLVDERSVNIIDHGFVPNFVGSDLAKYEMRVTAASPVDVALASLRRRSLVEGYGPIPRTARAAFTLAKLRRAASSSTSAFRRRRWWGRRRLESLVSGIDTMST